MDAVLTVLGVILLIVVFALVCDHFFFVDGSDEEKVIRRRRPENAASQLIRCYDCQQPIRRRADLHVVGRFRGGMLPVHRSCAAAPGSIAHAPLSEGQLNGRSSLLRNLLRLNVLMLGSYLLARALLPSSDLPGLLAIAAVGNAWLVVFRAVSYLTLERRLP